MPLPSCLHYSWLQIKGLQGHAFKTTTELQSSITPLQADSSAVCRVLQFQCLPRDVLPCL